VSVSGEEQPPLFKKYSENHQGQDSPVPGHPSAALAKADTVVREAWHNLPDPFFLRRSLNYHLSAGGHWDVLLLSRHFQARAQRRGVNVPPLPLMHTGGNSWMKSSR